MLFDPLVSFDTISTDELNDCLVRWDHKMGPLHRPQFGNLACAHGLRHSGRLVAVVATDALVAQQTCGHTRQDSFELARVCAERPGLCRVAVRLWRAFVFPAICRHGGYSWAISYQDRVQHRGDLYRMDGWVRRGFTSSGTDPRGRDGMRKGRRKVVWGWTENADLMAIARAEDQARSQAKHAA